MDCGIYVITNTVNNKKYVGSSKNLKRRKHFHFYRLKIGKHVNSYLQSSYNKHGKEAFHFMVLEYCEPDMLMIREDYWIALLDSRNPDKGYNLRKADRTEISEETRAKMRKPKSEEHKRNIALSKMGNTNGRNRRGIPHTEETKARMSIAHKGCFAWNKGIPVSEEQKSKQSIAMKGKPWTEARRAAQNKKATQSD